MAELGDGGGGSRSNMGSSSSVKSDTAKKSSEGAEGGTSVGAGDTGASNGVTMLGTVDLSGILSTPLSSSGYRTPYGSVNGTVPTAAAAPKRQQTIIVVTTVLTGYVTPSTIYPALSTTAPPMVSYTTATSTMPATSTLPSMTLAGVAAPWSAPLQTQALTHPSYAYSGYDNSANMYYPPPGASYFQQQQSHMPWSGGNGMPSLPPVVNPPPPPAESIPMPPPPSAAATAMNQSPWMTTADHQQQQGQPGIPYNYVTGR